MNPLTYAGATVGRPCIGLLQEVKTIRQINRERTSAKPMRFQKSDYFLRCKMIMRRAYGSM